MTDHWGFVVAAYSLAVVVLGGYWRRLCRRERELMTLRDDRASRSRQPSMTGHPHSEPASPTPRQP
jgi:hypothetical protein